MKGLRTKSTTSRTIHRLKVKSWIVSATRSKRADVIQALLNKELELGKEKSNNLKAQDTTVLSVVASSERASDLRHQPPLSAVSPASPAASPADNLVNIANSRR